MAPDFLAFTCKGVQMAPDFPTFTCQSVRMAPDFLTFTCTSVTFLHVTWMGSGSGREGAGWGVSSGREGAGGVRGVSG